MTNLHLIRYNHKKADIRNLNCSIKALNEVLDSNDHISREVLRELIDFQDADGSFKLLDTYHVESDIRIDFCHVPTYLASAILMKAFLEDPDCLTGKEEHVLVRALTMCCARGLNGHGFDDLSGQIAAMQIFIRAGVQEFIHRYPNICPKFTMMINSIVDRYRSFIQEGKFVFYFGENHEHDFRKIVSLFQEEYYVFVYGTLMKGRRNYSHYLAPKYPCTSATLNGYKMYDIGSFPGIVQGSGSIKGEVYRVSARQLASIDRLEGEGNLYIRKPETVQIDNEYTLHVNVYVYNGSVKNLPEIPFEKQPYGQEEKVWYVSYGSNLLEERFACYIQGGYCRFNGRKYNGCSDTAMPQKSIPVTIPYDMYFANYDKGTWKHSAVCFLDVSKPGKSLGRAWLVTPEQLDDIHRCEGKGPDWYPVCKQLDDIDGIPAYTFINTERKQHEPFTRVSPEYQTVLRLGILESYPCMTGKEIVQYLKQCGQ